jgi:hypothetical protein
MQAQEIPISAIRSTRPVGIGATPSEISAILAMHKQGRTKKDIAITLGFSYRAILDIVRREASRPRPVTGSLYSDTKGPKPAPNAQKNIAATLSIYARYKAILAEAAQHGLDLRDPNPTITVSLDELAGKLGVLRLVS